LKPLIVIITGLAGSGKTVALRALEDDGFFCVDNLPITLMGPFTSVVTADEHTRKVGIGIDVREKKFLPELDSALSLLHEKYNLEIIFLEADKDSLIRRFKETRRPHPLVSEQIDLEKAIEIEKSMLSPLQREATRIIDTSAYTPHQLRYLISSLFRMPEGTAVMAVTLLSFGHKFGIPQTVDILFDVRFLPNPHFVTSLRDLKGTDAVVQGFVLKQPSTEEFMDKVSALLNFLIPRYIEEGKRYLTIGFGCTGGQHRSPAIVERIAGMIRDNPIDVSIVHRDI